MLVSARIRDLATGQEFEYSDVLEVSQKLRVQSIDVDSLMKFCLELLCLEFHFCGQIMGLDDAEDVFMDALCIHSSLGGRKAVPSNAAVSFDIEALHHGPKAGVLPKGPLTVLYSIVCSLDDAPEPLVRAQYALTRATPIH